MTISLYRRYRPGTFGEVTGQDVAVDVLKKALQRGRVGHAYLFSGPRGCGKTTVARLLAKALNCLDPKDGYEPCGECSSCLAITAGDSLDVIEIDGASNNGVEEIRELKSHVSLAPFSSKWKVYIIDEVHMLSIAAFNALLKTLEEPPPLVAFILATTEPSKVPVTIRSRCRHVPFRRISGPDIQKRLAEVADREKIPWEESAIREISRQADGALRDGLSIMEQALSLGGGELSAQAVDRLLGGGTLSDLEEWVSLAGEDSVKPFAALEEMFLRGASPQRVVEGLFILFRTLWVCRKWGPAALASLSLSEAETGFLEEEAPKWTANDLSGMMLFCSRLIPQVRSGLRSDVLSGLLASRILEGPAEGPSAPAEPPAAERKERTPPGARRPSPDGRGEPKRMEKTHPAAKEEDKPLSPEVPAEPLPLAPENWRSFEEALFERDFLLYCSLADTNISMEDGAINVLFEKEETYRFETLSIERNAYCLASRALEYFGDSVAVVLQQGGRQKKCTGSGVGVCDEREEWQGSAQTQTLFKAPEGKGDSPEGEKGNDPRASLPPSGNGVGEGRGIPFEGVVREILKWDGGEVVLVKREDREETLPEEGVAEGE